MNQANARAVILIVEDEANGAGDLESQLSSLGYSVCGKVTGFSALVRAVEERTPDLVIVNLGFSGAEDGLMAADAVRDQWRIPVVFLVANTDAPIIEKVKMAAPYGYVIKPIRERDLAACLETALYVGKVENERRRAEDRAASLSMVIDQSMDAIIRTDREFRITYANKAVEDLYGYDLKELKGLFPSALVAEPNAKELLRELSQTLGRGRYAAKEIECRRKDGTTFICRIKISPLKDKKGNITGYMCSQHDVTERHRVGEALRESEERFRKMYQNAPLGYQSLDGNGHFIDVNQAWLDTLGYSKEEVLGKSFGDFLALEWRDHFKLIFPKLKAAGEILGVEFEMVKRDGSIILVSFDGKIGKHSDGAYKQAHCVLRDITEKRKIEQALKESEERHRLLFENAGTLISVYNERGDCLMMNNKVAQWFGGAPEDFVGKNFAELHPPEAEEYTRRIAEVIRTGEITDYEDKVVFPEKVRWLYSSVYPVRGASGAIVAAQIMSRDVSERKKAEEALAESERRYRSIFENAREGIFQSTPEGRFIRVNPAMAAMCEYDSPEDMVETVTDIATQYYANPEDRAQYRRTLEEYGYIEDFEIKVKKKNGEEIWVSGSTRTILDNRGSIEFLEGMVFDITERKKIMVELERIFTMSLDLICIADIGTVTFKKVNPAFAQTLGYSEKELLERPFTDFIHPDDLEPTRQVITEKLKRGENVMGFENRYQDKNGDYHWLRWVSQPIPEEGIAYAVGHDMTEAKQAEEERGRLRAQLQQAQKMEAVGTLAGGVAHDFNNLLQVIGGYAQLLFLDSAENTKAHEMLGNILSAGNRAKDLIRQLLLFSRKLETKKKPVSLNRQIDQAVKILERTIPRMIDIQLHLGRRLWSINADPVQIEQILLNLGANAADAMPDGGKLLIETRNLTLNENDTRDQISAKPGKYVLWAVSDTGQGMEKEVVEHIFEPFFTTKEFGKGTGLGLASAYGIVKSHGGYINCYSEPGQGAIFKIYLPAIDHVELEEAPIETAGEYKRGSETVMVVDDEEQIRIFASQALENFGYSVITAASGEEALEKYDSVSVPPDIVILDVGMPGMGGRNCLQEILKRNRDAKVLIASGYSINDQVKNILEIGAAGFIAKPYQLKGLLAKIREVLDERTK